MTNTATSASCEISSDAGLVAGIAAGNAACLDQLYARYSTLVFSLAYRIATDASIADEVAQDVFMQVWREAFRYDSARGSVRVWLVVMARTRALDRVRARRARKGRSLSLDKVDAAAPIEPPTSPEILAVTEEEAARVRLALSILPASDRRLVDLAYFQGCTQREIAHALGQPLGTIKTRTRRVLTVLRCAICHWTGHPFRWDGGSPPAAVRSGRVLENLHLLVVDDHLDTLRLLTLVLERAGATVVGAPSAAQALKRLDHPWPDAIVADLEMPAQDGCAFLQQVRARGRREGRAVPAVAFTAYNSDHDRSRTSQAGFDVHLSKPVTPRVLIASIAALVGRRAAPATAAL